MNKGQKLYTSLNVTLTLRITQYIYIYIFITGILNYYKFDIYSVILYLQLPIADFNFEGLIFGRTLNIYCGAYFSKY